MRWALGLVLLAGCADAQLPQRASTIRVMSGSPCGPLTWPVDAPVSSGFGRRDARQHLGIDLVVPEGTPVHAACDGTVGYASDKLRGYGRLVILDHAGGLTTVYAHNEALLVQVGARIARGQVIARSGQTGHVTAPHVHFEVRRAGRAVDPLGQLGARQENRATEVRARRAAR